MDKERQKHLTNTKLVQINLSMEEYEFLQSFTKRNSTSLSNAVRRCIDSMIRLERLNDIHPDLEIPVADYLQVFGP